MIQKIIIREVSGQYTIINDLGQLSLVLHPEQGSLEKGA